jgi:hypothetical protein
MDIDEHNKIYAFLNLFIKVLLIQDILVLVIQLSMVGVAHHLLWQC